MIKEKPRRNFLGVDDLGKCHMLQYYISQGSNDKKSKQKPIYFLIFKLSNVVTQCHNIQIYPITIICYYKIYKQQIYLGISKRCYFGC